MNARLRIIFGGGSLLLGLLLAMGMLPWFAPARSATEAPAPASFNPPVQESPAVDLEDYVWEKAWYIQNNQPSASEAQIRQELRSEIDVLLEVCCSAGSNRHLGPHYVAQGFLVEDLYWLNPAETILVLSEALEFLPPSQQERVISYLKFEMQSEAYNPLTYQIEYGIPNPLVDKQTFRAYYRPLPDELARGYLKMLDTGIITSRPENLYAAWAFAHYVSQFENPSSTPSAWELIEDNWVAIESLFRFIPDTPRTYWQIMGAIGYARMAEELGRPYQAAVDKALAGLQSGDDYVQFYYNMNSEVGCFGNNGDIQGYEGVWDYCAFSAADPYGLYDRIYNHQEYAGAYITNRPSMFATEIGRFLKDNSQSLVMSHLNRYLSPQGESYFPFWWENRGTKPWAVRDENTGWPGNAENAIMHPSFAWQLFLLQAYVFPNQTGESMGRYIDTPISVGDIFHLQKLIATLRLYSGVQWAEDDPFTGLRYQKHVEPPFGDEGDVVHFELTIQNNAGEITTTTYLTDNLPTSLSLVPGSLSASMGQASIDNGQLTWSEIIATNPEVVISYDMQIMSSATEVVLNTASFFNQLYNNRIEERQSTVIINGPLTGLPEIPNNSFNPLQEASPGPVSTTAPDLKRTPNNLEKSSPPPDSQETPLTCFPFNLPAFVSPD